MNTARRLMLRMMRGGGGVALPELALLVTGQSNGSPSDATVYSTTPSARHTRDAYGVRSRAADITGTLVGLYEQVSDTGAGSGETIASAFSQTHDQLTGESARWFHANHAIPAHTMAHIRKGGTGPAYANGMAQVTAAVAAAPGLVVAGIALIHGETDQQTNNTNYPAQLDTLQDDYDADIKALTGQAGEVVMYCSQPGSVPPGSTSATGADKSGSTALTYLSRAVSTPTEFACVGPTYFAVLRADGGHWVAAFTRILGAYFAKAVKKHRAAEDALPLYPTAAVRTAASVVVTFHVPVPPLVWRLDLYQPTTSGNTGAVLGFKFYDDSGSPPAVTDVQITGTDEVTVTLAGTPTGSQGSQEIRIAHSTSQNSGTGGTPLADSDPTVNPQGWPLPNFCCMSYVPVTV